MTRRLIPTLLSLAFAACSMQSSGGDTADERLAEVEDELHRHHGALMGATSLADVDGEALTHGANMHGIMDEIAGTMPDRMAHCSSPSMHRMGNMMSHMDAEMRDHVAALENAMNIDAAQALCMSHLAEMSEMIATMRGTLGRASCGMMAR